MNAGENSPIGGLRPAVSAACREFLLALEECRPDQQKPDQQKHVGAKHAAECLQCAAHAAFRAKFTKLLKTRPTPPAILLSREILESTQERIVDAIEATSSIGELIAGVPAAEHGWSVPMPESSIAHAMSTSPRSPSASTWSAVQKSVIAAVGSQRAAGTRIGLWLGAAGLAAAAIVGTLLPWSGTAHTPAIVFADLESMPSVEFSVIRYGALR